MITRLSFGINCIKNFAVSVFPAPGSPPNTKFIPAFTQFKSRCSTFSSQKSLFNIPSIVFLTRQGDLRIQTLVPVAATESWMILIRSSFVSASNTLFALLNCASTQFAMLCVKVSKKFSVTFSSASFALYLPFLRSVIHRAEPL